MFVVSFHKYKGQLLKENLSIHQTERQKYKEIWTVYLSIYTQTHTTAERALAGALATSEMLVFKFVLQVLADCELLQSEGGKSIKAAKICRLSGIYVIWVKERRKRKEKKERKLC